MFPGVPYLAAYCTNIGLSAATPTSMPPFMVYMYSVSFAVVELFPSFWHHLPGPLEIQLHRALGTNDIG